MYKFSILRFIRKELLWGLVINFVISCLFSTYGGRVNIGEFFFYFSFLTFLLLAIRSPWHINYIFNDWGKELHIDKRRKEMFLKKGEDEMFLPFSEIDCVRKFHNGKFLNRNQQWHYRIHLKEPRDYVFFISHLSAENLEKELETEVIPFYRSLRGGAFIPNWKIPSKRTLTEKVYEFYDDINDECEAQKTASR